LALLFFCTPAPWRIRLPRQDAKNITLRPFFKEDKLRLCLYISRYLLSSVITHLPCAGASGPRRAEWNRNRPIRTHAAQGPCHRASGRHWASARSCLFPKWFLRHSRVAGWRLYHYLRSRGLRATEHQQCHPGRRRNPDPECDAEGCWNQRAGGCFRERRRT
jgi:hypothetical protein